MFLLFFASSSALTSCYIPFCLITSLEMLASKNPWWPLIFWSNTPPCYSLWLI